MSAESGNIFSGTYKKIFIDFQQFMFSNTVLLAATGFCVGIATKEVIEKLVNLIILPIIHTIFKLTIQNAHSKLLTRITQPIVLSVLTTISDVIWSLFVWIIIIIMTFILLEYVLNRNVIGMKTIVKEDQKINFVKSKTDVNDNIIPTKEEVKQLEKEQKVEEKAAIQIKSMEQKTINQAANDPNKSIAIVADRTPTEKRQNQPIITTSNQETIIDTFFAPLL